jgi:hypothetical protein
MASEQPQPSSEKFTSYEYGIECFAFVSSCRVTTVTDVVESDQSSQLSSKRLTWRLSRPKEGGSAVSRNENRLHICYFKY